MKISVQRYRATGSLKKTLKKKLVSSRMTIPTLFLGTLILLACLHIWQRVYVMELAREASACESENRYLKDLVKKADMQIVELTRSARIEEFATNEFGLLRTGSENMYTLTLNGAEENANGLGEVVTSLKKIADNLPVLNESKAATGNIFEFYEE
jgi:hypothetical protein